MASPLINEWLSPSDPHSFARPDECCVVDLKLDLHVDFSSKVVHGTAEYKCKRKDGVSELVLDTDGISVSRVYCKQTSQDLQFTLFEPLGPFGSKLQINLLQSFDQEFEVCVDFKNSPSATGLQWLTAEQTVGKRQPYMFSQFQPIFARSMLPCQDTPGVKHPFRAKVTTDKELTVVMSAVPQGSSPSGDNKVTYEFYQKIPIPSNLIAIAVGDIVSKEIGPRSKVWTEREMIDKAAKEFDETETMLATAEALCGPYVWGVYDLLVLPPSFPYGGMENPCLTFVTPSLLAGDKSATSTVVHEIAHSWTGNLVTNKDWEQFWLNEGHTVFVERKIIGRMYGEQHRQFGFIGGWTDLAAAVNVYGETHEFTKLIPNLTGYHPDDAFSKVPYEKGAALLYTIETTLGGADVFEPWLRAYIQRFNGKSLCTDEWKDFLYEFFHDKHDALNSIDWDSWLYGVGMPTKPDYDKTLYNACEELSNRWLSGDNLPQDRREFNQFSTNQKIQFLNTLVSKDPMPQDRIRLLGQMYGLPEMNNTDIKCKWLQLCLRGKIEDHLEDTLKFVTEVGGVKFVRPIYRDLYAFEAVRQRAIDTFKANLPQMHSITVNMVEIDLHLKQSDSSC